jgi:ribosome-binding factor A
MSKVGGSGKRRASERVRQLVAEALERHASDPRLTWVTVTEVRATSDLKTATVFFTVLDARKRAGAEAALASARGMIQGRIGARLGTRNTPQLDFVFDDHQARARELTTLIEGLEVHPDPEALGE